MRDRLAAAVTSAVAGLQLGLGIDGSLPAVALERPQRREHGDWSTNIAMQLARPARMNPRELAQTIIDAIEPMDEVSAIAIAGPGFINFTLKPSALATVIRAVAEAGDRWGRIRDPDGEKINLEFVSANPTGPLHLGHGRWAAAGDALASILDAAGNDVEREFYVNDWGRQMELFGESIAARYLGLFGVETEIPEGGYHGSYVNEIAVAIKDADADRWVKVPAEERIAAFQIIGRDRMLEIQKQALERFRVRYDTWFSETSLHESGAVERGLDRLRDAGHSFEEDGALWIRSTDFGDDKDRVIRRADGTTTYLAPDVAYYLDKKSRGFDRLIYVLGADHHGYVGRMKAIIAAVGDEPAEAEFLIGQMVTLLRSGEPVKMSKRTGEFVTFEELIDEVGVDAARYTFVRQSMDTHMDFDLDLVVRQSQDNPVFYVQYAHARIAAILRFAAEGGTPLKPLDDVSLERLTEDAELGLLRTVAELPEIVELAARRREPHRVPRYAEELATAFHSFYQSGRERAERRVVTGDADLTQARLHLCVAAKTTLANALALVGVTAPDRMDRVPEDEPIGG